MKRIWFFYLLLILPATAFAQGGPPLATDDPFTPGNKNWEINLAAQVVTSHEQKIYDAPLWDINYGYHDNLQFNLVLGWIRARDVDGEDSKGLSAGSLAVKWRFIGDEKSPLAVSIYPRVDSRWPFSSRHPAVAGDGRRYFLPVEVAFKLGAINVNPEVGYAYSTKQEDEYVYGVAFGYEFAAGKELLFEVHSDAAKGQDASLLTQIGGRYFVVPERLGFLGAFGHSAKHGDQPEFWNFYLGLQLKI